jgi:hypothetical protein
MKMAYQPQQSVLYPQFGHRHTACMRNISTPQRSQSTASDFADGVVERVGVGVGVRGASGRGSVSDMMGFYFGFSGSRVLRFSGSPVR